MTPYDQSQTERALRESLSERARQVQPSPRLDAILREAAAPTPGAARGRWLAGVAVAAAAAVVAGTVWASRPDNDATLPGGEPSSSPTATGALSPSASPTSPSGTSTPSASGSPSASPSSRRPATGEVALAIYRVGTNGGETNRPGLVREFWSTTLATGTTESAKASAAVAESLSRSDLWRGVTLNDAEVARGGITLALSGPGENAPDAERARLAVASLVWTAQGAVGRGDLPVSLTTPSGGRLLGQLDPAAEYTRAGTPPEALCDIWVDSPSPGASLRASEPVVVRGQAVVFEANVEWELRRGGETVRDGFTTASIGAPGRGTFTIDLGRLDPGSYTVRAFSSSAKDGTTVVAERLVGFSVR